MITINGKNIIKVYIGNNPCSQVYSGVNPLFNEVVDIQGLEGFEYGFFYCTGSVTYKDNGAIIKLYGDGSSWCGTYLTTNALKKNKNYKVSLKCSVNNGSQYMYLEVGSKSESYAINSREQTIEKTFSNVDSNTLYIELGYQTTSSGGIGQFTIKDFQIIEV